MRMADYVAGITCHAPKPPTLGAAENMPMSPSSSWYLSFRNRSSSVLQPSCPPDNSTRKTLGRDATDPPHKSNRRFARTRLFRANHLQRDSISGCSTPLLLASKQYRLRPPYRLHKAKAQPMAMPYGIHNTIPA